MKLNDLSFLILLCIHKFNGERSIYGVYHLLTGKKSSQTIFDGKLYELSHLFSIMPFLTRDKLEEIIQQLQRKKLIKKIEEHKYVVTKYGFDCLIVYKEQNPLPKDLDGWKYYDKGVTLWERLSLLIQVLSNLNHRKSKYTPINHDEELQNWIKAYILRLRLTRGELAEQIHDECVQLLSTVQDEDALLFVSRLTSHDRIGSTFEQLANLLHKDIVRIHILFHGVLHTFLKEIELATKKYPYLFEVVKDLYHEESLTLSSRQTLRMIQEGKSINEIAAIRHLKQSTIEDHVVEIAQNVSDFSIDSFVTSGNQDKIITMQKELNSKKMKVIKEELGQTVSYFEIRLVLARNGENNGT